MKFSHEWLKSYIPKLPKKAAVIDLLSTRSFEAEDAAGDIIEVKLPPNRYADCASHMGLARELAAAAGLSYKAPKIPPIKKISRGWTGISIKDSARCALYTATFIDDLRPAKSPGWMTGRLRACGMRPISAVVDVMNYVMLETGQPLHAFDADLLHGPITVRAAARGESIETLDEKNIALDPDILVIADGKGPLAIAGIKGGKRAEVGPKTKRIIIESAHFDPISVYRTSRRINLTTDASVRFAHSVNPETALLGAARAAQLLKEIKASASVPGTVVAGQLPKTRSVIDIDPAWLSRFLGVTLSHTQIKKLISPLGFEVFAPLKNIVRIAIPSFRLDIESREDVAEEIARMYGYDRIPVSAPRISPQAEPNTLRDLMSHVRSALTLVGYSEAYTHSFVPKNYADGNPKKTPLALENPISSEYAYLRTELTPANVHAGRENLRFAETVRMFELGSVFFAVDGKTQEHIHACITLSTKKLSAEHALRELKGVVDELARTLHIPVSYGDELDAHPHARPGHIARITSGSSVLGSIGISNMSTADKPSAFAELFIAGLMKHAQPEMKYAHPAKYPAIERDISMFVPKKVRVADAEEAIRGSKPQHLSRVKLLEVYLPKEDRSRKSIAVRLTFRSTDRTLTEREVEQEFEKVLRTLQQSLGAEIR
jgi:phenylalanyl-tRNA synthetase beta chain